MAPSLAVGSNCDPANAIAGGDGFGSRRGPIWGWVLRKIEMPGTHRKRPDGAVARKRRAIRHGRGCPKPGEGRSWARGSIRYCRLRWPGWGLGPGTHGGRRLGRMRPCSGFTDGQQAAEQTQAQRARASAGQHTGGGPPTHGERESAAHAGGREHIRRTYKPPRKVAMKALMMRHTGCCSSGTRRARWAPEPRGTLAIDEVMVVSPSSQGNEQEEGAAREDGGRVCGFSCRWRHSFKVAPLLWSDSPAAGIAVKGGSDCAAKAEGHDGESLGVRRQGMEKSPATGESHGTSSALAQSCAGPFYDSCCASAIRKSSLPLLASRSSSASSAPAPGRDTVGDPGQTHPARAE